MTAAAETWTTTNANECNKKTGKMKNKTHHQVEQQQQQQLKLQLAWVRR